MVCLGRKRRGEDIQRTCLLPSTGAGPKKNRPVQRRQGLWPDRARMSASRRARRKIIGFLAYCREFNCTVLGFTSDFLVWCHFQWGGIPLEHGMDSFRLGFFAKSENYFHKGDAASLTGKMKSWSCLCCEHEDPKVCSCSTFG